MEPATSVNVLLQVYDILADENLYGNKTVGMAEKRLRKSMMVGRLDDYVETHDAEGGISGGRFRFRDPGLVDFLLFDSRPC